MATRCRIGSRGSRVDGPVDGWLVIYDEVCDTDPTALLRFARETSTRLGAVAIALSLELDDVVRMYVLDRGGSSTSTCRSRSSTGRCRPAT